jgi:hypothetical protein
MEIYERKNKGGNHKELQDLDPIGFPHKEEKVIGRNVDLDLLSLFPQKDARIMGGMGRKSKLFKVNNGGERENGRANSDLRKRTTIYRPAQNQPVGGDLPQKFRPEGQKFRGLLKAEIPACGQNSAPGAEFPSPL